MSTTFSLGLKEDFISLADTLRASAGAYYSGADVVPMDDATYDAGIRALREARAANPGWTEADDLLDQVAAGTSKGNEVRHNTPMLSLDNCFSAEDVREFMGRVSRKTGKQIDDIAWAVEPKLDGCALSILYRDGQLVRVVTRGDGLAGDDVTNNAVHVNGILSSLPQPWSGEVRGECIMTSEDFEQANQLRVAHGDKPFSNPRNSVSGSLTTIHRPYIVPMSFYAYDVASESLAGDSHDDRMSALEAFGFRCARSVIDQQPVVVGADGVLHIIEQIELARPSLPLDIDGAVIKVNDPEIRDLAGMSSRSPRWAIAYKYPAQTRITRLLDIEVGVGRTGNISYTAVLEPVDVGNVSVTHAMVHNPSEIARHGFRIPRDGAPGQRVEVYRAGDVIPQIRGVVDPGDTDGTEPYVPADTCPNGHPINKDQKVWRCSQGRMCSLKRNASHFVSRDYGLDIEGLGKVHISTMVDLGLVSGVADLYDLTMADLMKVERLGEKNAAKILANIDQSRSAPVHKVISALGINMTGRSMSRRLAKRFPTLSALRDATAAELQEVEGVGPDRAAAIVEDLDLIRSTIDRLVNLGVGEPSALAEAPSSPAPQDLPLAGKTVVVTGTVPGMTRTQAQEAVEALGGRASSSVSKSTDLVVVGDGAGSKASKAASLGVPVMGADEFAALAGR